LVLRYVIYARYSSDLQSPDSIEDQRRKCREYASKEGWGGEVRCYEDAALSGVGTDRVGFQRLMADAANPTRDFDLLLTDDSSRLSRTLPDVLSLHQRLAHYGVRVIAVSQGIDTGREESDILIAVHGITDSLYVKELGKKTHRGLEGKFLKGLSAGGRCYGYEILREEAGSRSVINEAEACTVRQIYEWSAAGYSLKRIAGLLNDHKVPPPQKRKNRPHATWCPTAIRAMLRRELYIGKRIWNRTKFVKTPGTNKRVARPRPQGEWQVQDVPSLQIVSLDLWNRVQARLDRLKKIYGDNGRKPVNRGASSCYLLSGILRCGTCDAKLIIVSGGKKGARYGCPQHWNRKACSNGITVPHEQLERLVFQELQAAVLSPDSIEYVVSKIVNVQGRKKAATERERRVKELEGEIQRTVAAIAAIGHSEALAKGLKEREAELRELSAIQETSHELSAEEIRDHISNAVRDIPALLAKAPELAKTKLAQHIDSIRLIPQPDGTYIAEGEWDLLGNRGPVMVAGAGFEPATFGL
jgi:DNA invertase Pin-like site-specific DNA recombinase